MYGVSKTLIGIRALTLPKPSIMLVESQIAKFLTFGLGSRSAHEDFNDLKRECCKGLESTSR